MKGKSKTLKIILIAILAALIVVGGYFLYNSLKKEEKPQSKITPILYEVTKEGSNNKMYLFGTIHFANEVDLVFPDYVLDAYNNSHYLACEFNMVEYLNDLDSQMNDAMKLIYDDGTTIKDHIREELYNKLIAFLKEKNAYSSLYESYKPYLFLSLLTSVMAEDAKISGDSGIDLYFLKKAIAEGKTILEVESSEFQTDLLLEFDDELYEMLIEETIDDYDEGVEELKKLYEAWKNGNVKELELYSDDEIDIKEDYDAKIKEYAEEYNKKLIYERNDTMTTKAIEYFNNNQDVFFMVGTLHIVGETGLAKQLSDKGFTIKQITK